MGFWTGYTDAASEGDYVWSSGEPAIFENWGGGEPDDISSTKDCAFLLSTSYSWNDYMCGGDYAYLCERWPGLP